MVCPAFSLPGLSSPRDKNVHSDPTPVSSMWQELVTIFDARCSETDMSFSAFFSCENPESGYLLGHIGKCRRGEELDDAECTALSPLFLSGLTLLISESRKSMSIHTCVCTHTHTDAHTHPGACKRIPCLPSIDECPSVATLYQARVGSRARQGMDGREWFLPSGCF